MNKIQDLSSTSPVPSPCCRRRSASSAAPSRPGARTAPAQPVTWRPRCRCVWGALDGGRAQRSEQRDQPDLRPRDRPREQAEAPAAGGPLTMGEAWGFTIGSFVRGVGAGLARRAAGARGAARVLLDRALHQRAGLGLLGAAAAHQAPRHLGERDDRRTARPAAQGRRLVDGQDDRSAPSRGSSARSSACSCSAPRPPRTSPTSRATARVAASTLPILYGVKTAAWIIAPFFVLPFALIPIGVRTGILTGNPLLLDLLAAALIALRHLHRYLLVRRPRSSRSPRTTLVDAHVPDDDGGAGRLRARLRAVAGSPLRRAVMASAGVAARDGEERDRRGARLLLRPALERLAEDLAQHVLVDRASCSAAGSQLARHQAGDRRPRRPRRPPIRSAFGPSPARPSAPV